ncbi:uncharacterized protein LOC128551992 [Mercenaria mercenaria]|uniref:uncharacterized protein LOC128551992 n=1 Tax=Mercenaria mercenaria TaxID=6596 RepID=UPI00234E8F43|nr:uncharacterized protein LOC128551992 [Mercenaria mercenaria]
MKIGQSRTSTDKYMDLQWKREADEDRDRHRKRKTGRRGRREERQTMETSTTTKNVHASAAHVDNDIDRDNDNDGNDGVEDDNDDDDDDFGGGGDDAICSGLIKISAEWTDANTEQIPRTEQEKDPAKLVRDEYLPYELVYVAVICVGVG